MTERTRGPTTRPTRRDDRPGGRTGSAGYDPRVPGRAHVPPEIERRHLVLLRAFAALEMQRSVLAAIAGVGVVAFVALVLARIHATGSQLVLAFLPTVVAFAAVTYALATAFRPRRVARAFEVYRWVGRHDWLAWRRRAGRRVPQSRAAAAAWLDAELRRPDAAIRDQLPRIELYVWLGRIDDAARAADALPADRPWDQFERHLLRSFVAFCGGTGDEGRGALEEARRAAEQLSGPERRLAAAKLAVEDARRLAFREGLGTRRGVPTASADAPWLEPLVAVRDRLGPSLDGFLVRDLARWAVPVLVVLGGVSAVSSFVVSELL